MRITAKVDYAVRAAAELAARYGEVDEGGSGYVKAAVVAQDQGMPLPLALGILNELKLAGLVESRRGSDGGYRLAVPPERIPVADVVRVIDGPLANVAGTYVEELEYPAAAVAVRDVWVAVRAALRSVLDEVTLADLVSGALSPDVRALIAGEDAWRTRPNRRDTRAG